MYVRSVNKDRPFRLGAVPEDPEAEGKRRFCHIPGCAWERPIGEIMCDRHWAEVPADMARKARAAMGDWLGGLITVETYVKARLKALIFVSHLHGIDAGRFQAELEKWEKAS